MQKREISELKSSSSNCKREIIWREADCPSESDEDLDCDSTKTLKYKKMTRTCKTFKARQLKKAEDCE